MRRVLFLSAVFLLAFFVCLAFALEETVENIVSKVQAAYSAMNDYQADFTQEIKTGRGARSASGKLLIKMPGKMRWDYASPVKKHLITDGNTSWMLLPEENQVYVQPLARSASVKVPLQMLTGTLDFEKDYFASLLEEGDGVHRIRINPKKKNMGFDHAVIHIDKKTLRIVRFELLDLYGTRTTVTLKNAGMNRGMKDGLFAYKPKPGIEVIKVP